MNSALNIADQAIAKIEAEEQGIIPAEDDKKTEVKDDKDAGKAEETAKDDKSDKSGTEKDSEADAGADSDKEDEEEGQFTADDALEVDEKTTEPEAPATDASGIQLSPAESKHIADNIGDPLVLKGMVGDKEVEIKAYTPNDIPADFKFANDAQMIAAQNGFQRLEQKAEQLLGNFRQNQSQEQARDFERRENEGIRADVADLQKEGRFPKFKVQPGTDGFDDSAEAKLMQEVLNVMTEKNELYFKQYQQGRPYKHIGFAEAFDIFERTNPDRVAQRKADKDQEQEDKDRKKVSDKVGTGGGEPAYNIQKPTIKSGTTINDILNRIDMED